MSEYHNQQAMDQRLSQRRQHPSQPFPLKVFYHISCMNNWQEVVVEQLRLLAHAGLQTVKSCVLGKLKEGEWCRQKAREFGIALETPVVIDNMGLYEGPTLDMLWLWARSHPEGSVLYFHTKGVSNPRNLHKIQWRRLMARHVIANWQANLDHLALADMVGVSWQEQPDFPHFCGNFWMARCDWIANLQPPCVYRWRHPDLLWAGLSWKDRMYVETWIGSEGYHHLESFVCRNACLWEGPQVFSYDVNIPGFNYED